MKNIHLRVYTDGGARGNPGHAAYGIVIYDNNGKVLHQHGQYIGISTNNVAEYAGLLAALQWVNTYRAGQDKNHMLKTVTFLLDSMLVVCQMTGKFKVRDIRLKTLFANAKELERKIPAKIEYLYISREKNKVADALVNKALDTYFDTG